MSDTPVIIICTLLLVPFVWHLLLKHPKSLPPGPPRSWLWDNTKDVPPSRIGIIFRSWNQQYGPFFMPFYSEQVAHY